jgi:hypothetical protein
MAETTCDINLTSERVKNPPPFFRVQGKAQKSAAFPETVKDSGISSCWRKNTSFRESIELANVLRAFQKVAGHIGENIGRIEYTGMSSEGAAIQINPELVMGEYPVPPDLFDNLLGLVVHEALHKTQWSDHLWKLLEPEMAKMAPMEHLIFQRFVYTGEEIYIDRKAEESVFGLYTRVSREKEMRALDRKIPSSAPSVDELFFFWWTRHLQFTPAREKKKEYVLLLNGLDSLAGKLADTLLLPVGIDAKCRQRAHLFLNVWDLIRDEIQSLPIIKKQLHWFRTIQPPDAPNKTKKSPGSLPLKASLALEIQTNLAIESADITPLIRSVVGGEDDRVVPMSRWDFNIPSHPVIDKRMVGRLKTIFQNYATRKTVTNRGLLSGKTDQRRLYRVPLSGRCFKEVERIPSLDWSVSLLIDASGSMQGGKWRMVENTVANIHKAFLGYGNRLSALAYFEVNGICMISKLLKENTLLSIPPSGQTASGQAIIAAALMIPENKNKIIIHVTDGESNFGCDLSYGIEFCKKKKIHLVTLGCGYKERSIMEKQYKRAIQFVDHFEQLPNAMERLFKWTFLYGGKPSLHR